MLNQWIRNLAIALLSLGSAMAHADKLAELHTGMTCRIGIPVEQLAHGYHQNVSSPIYSTGIGLMLRGLLKGNFTAR